MIWRGVHQRRFWRDCWMIFEVFASKSFPSVAILRNGYHVFAVRLNSRQFAWSSVLRERYHSCLARLRNQVKGFLVITCINKGEKNARLILFLEASVLRHIIWFLHSFFFFQDPVPYVFAAPLHSNILEWHYVIKGAPQTPYEGKSVPYFVTACSIMKSTVSVSA